MSDQPKLIFRLEETGHLVMSFTGSAIEGVGKIDLTNPSPEAIVPQIRALQSPTGIIEAEFPGEGNVRNIQVAAPKASIAA